METPPSCHDYTKNLLQGAPLGNQYGLKLKDPDVRQEAYHQYCEWIAGGNSKKSFVFDHPEHTVTWETMEKYIKNHPEEFDPNKKLRAEALSLQVWEKRGFDMMIGMYQKCEPALYQMFMRNKFGWDREEKNPESTRKTQAERLLDLLEGKSN